MNLNSMTLVYNEFLSGATKNEVSGQDFKNNNPHQNNGKQIQEYIFEFFPSHISMQTNVD